MASLSTCHLELVVWDGNLVKLHRPDLVPHSGPHEYWDRHLSRQRSHWFPVELPLTEALNHKEYASVELPLTEVLNNKEYASVDLPLTEVLNNKEYWYASVDLPLHGSSPNTSKSSRIKYILLVRKYMV